uniref:Transposase of ISCARN105, IS3 family IS3 group,ORFB n=1 Tax=mine drainage metagenome TaxID=410659 RepID=E6QV37_9ZZZZ
MVAWIQEAADGGARRSRACAEAGLSLRTVQRWTEESGVIKTDARTTVERPAPSNKLSEAEVRAVLDACHRPDTAHLPPTQIVPRLVDEGVYLASESTFYRILKAEGMGARRGRAHPPRKVKLPTTHTATTANTVWSWDITYLPSPVRGQYYYLYLVEDLYSRKAVAWEVHMEESGDHAAALIQRGFTAEQCWRQPLVLHSDNGAPMKSSTLLAKLYDLGITPSRGRPRVSNDNPYSESLFRTLKYCPQWPESGFESLDAARRWVRDFIAWYNHEHRHSRIRFVTPAQRHRGEDHALLAKRHALYEAAKARNPARWSGGTRNWTPVGAVDLNPQRQDKKAA